MYTEPQPSYPKNRFRGKRASLVAILLIYLLCATSFVAWLAEAEIKGRFANREDEKSIKVDGELSTTNQTYKVLLITGDVVYVANTTRGLQVLSVEPADPSRTGQGFRVLNLGKKLYVIPNNIDLRKYDLNLFDVAYLIKEGYTDESTYRVIAKAPHRSALVSLTAKLESAKKELSVDGRVILSKLNLISIKIGKDAESVHRVFKELLESKDVERVWLDRKVHASLFESVPLVRAPQAWSIGYNGSGIRIAILDTGIDSTHEVFYFKNGTSKIVLQADFTDENDPRDFNGHGTFVASIAAGAEVNVARAEYAREIAPHAWLDGGTPMGWRADDMSWEYTLPFSFPFAGKNFTKIYISSNGLITFQRDASWWNSVESLRGKAAIAPAWDDWRTDRRPGDDIYIWQPEPACVAIRWRATAFYDPALEANFQAILCSNGTIRFNYGFFSGFASATVGISDGYSMIIAEDLTNLNYTNSRIYKPVGITHLQMSGVAPGALLMNAKVLNRYGWGYESWVIEGIEWAVNNGAHVISMSLGGGFTDGTDPLSQACDWAVSQGVNVVVAAGNEGSEYWTITSPGSAFNVITVGASTKLDEISWFSSRGPTQDGRIKPEIVAPGEGILAARLGGGYVSYSGTSAATPHVSGAVALVLQKNPSLTPGEVKDLLLSTAKFLPSYNVYEQGSGRLDIASAINAELYLRPARIEIKDNRNPFAQVPITIFSMSDRNVTVKFNVYYSSVDHPFGPFRSDAIFVLNRSVTIAPGGKVNVTLFVNLSSLPHYDYWGVIQVLNASNDRVLAHGVFSLLRWCKLIVKTIDSRGLPTAGSFVWIVRNETHVVYPRLNYFTEFFGSSNSSGMVEFLIPSGSYYVVTSRYDAESGRAFTLVKRVTITSDTMIELDERETHEVSLVGTLGLTAVQKSYIVAIPVYKRFAGGYGLTLRYLGWLFYYPISLSDFVSTSTPIFFKYELLPKDKINPSYPDLLDSDTLYIAAAFYENVTSKKVIAPQYDTTVTIEYRTYASPTVSMATAHDLAITFLYGGFNINLWTPSISYLMNAPRKLTVKLNQFWQGRLFTYASLWAYSYKMRDLPGVSTPWWYYGGRVEFLGSNAVGSNNSKLYLVSAPDLLRRSYVYYYVENSSLKELAVYAMLTGALNITRYYGLIQNFNVRIFVNGNTVAESGRYVSLPWLGVYVDDLSFPLPAKVEVLFDLSRNHLLSRRITTKYAFTIDESGDGERWMLYPLELDFNRGLEIAGLDMNNTLTVTGSTIINVFTNSRYNLTHVVLRYGFNGSWYNTTLISHTGFGAGLGKYTFKIGQVPNKTFVDLSLYLRDVRGNEMEQNITEAFFVNYFLPELTLAQFPSPFITDGVLNATFVVGGTQPHGPLGWGAWTVDVLSGILVASRLGFEASLNIKVGQIVDSDFIVYDPATRDVWVNWRKIPTSTVISIGSAGVNLLAYKYNKTGAIPYYFVFNGTHAYIYSRETGRRYYSGYGYDHAVIALVEEPNEGKCVLLVFGVTGRGSQAAGLVLSNFKHFRELLSGKAVIIRWEDRNGNDLPDEGESYLLVEAKS